MKLIALAALALMIGATLWYLAHREPVYQARWPLPPEDDDGVAPADARPYTLWVTVDRRGTVTEERPN